jgi:hypothetical protein
MQRFAAFVVVLLASCAGGTPSSINESVALQGVPGNAVCSSTEPYGGSFAVLKLKVPITFGSLRNVTQVELLMDEPQFVQYGHYIGKNTQVSCRLSQSNLCGYPQVSCGVSSIQVEP